MAIQLNASLPANPTTLPSTPATPPQPPRRTVGKKLEAIIELKTFAKTLEGVEVPYWVALATEDVELLLKEKKSPFFDDWKQLKALYEACAEKKKLLENPEAKRLIDQIQQEIHGSVKDRPWGEEWNLSDNVYWMVRSSGAEDGAVACAGYNLSLDYRLPHQMGQSISDVLRSYYNAEGIEARIQRGLNPFEKYHLSLFAQELIGEKMGGETETALIPKSAVVFTNEPMYVQGQNWRVMKIVTTLGHCSAITDNRGIATETIYILQGKDGKIYVVYDHLPKPERLAPVDGKLDVVPNPKEIVYEPVLDGKMLERLFDLGIKMEEFFGGGARDSELVIKNGIIYLLQSRPVNRSIGKAVYLDGEKSNLDVKEMKVVVPGHYNAFTLKEPKDLLNVDNLIDAPNEDYRLVVVHQDEPANSHPIVNFSEREIPVFLNPEEIDPPSNGDVLAICPQQGIVGRGPSSSFQFKEGYTDHPAPIAFGKRDLQKISSTDMGKVSDIIKQVRAAKEKAVGLKALESLDPYLKNFSERLVQAKAFAEPAKELKGLVDRTLDELNAAFDRGQRLEVLFYAKAVKVLFIDPPFSVLSLTELLKQAQEYETSVDGTADLASISVIPALNEQIRRHWIEFLKQAEQFPEKKELLSLLALLGDKKPLWLTFYFDSHFRKNSSPQALLQSLLQDIDVPSYEFINKLPQVIARPSTRLFDFFKSEEFKQGFKNSKPLARMIALDRLFVAVDLYDKLLKGIKMNLKLPFATKMKEFKGSFAPYYFLMDHVAREIVVNNRSLHSSIVGYLTDLRAKYDDIMGEEETPALLQPSPNFTVAAAALGSQAAFGRHRPETVEDLFTLAHQNFLAMISAMYKENLPPLEELTLPESLQAAVKELNQMSQRVQHIGVVQNEEELVFQFNIPLNNHSSTCQLKYKEGKLFLSTQLIGEGRSRWPAINSYLRILHELGIQPFEKLILRRDLVDVTWCLSKPEDAHNACNLMNSLYDRTFSADSNRPLINNFSSRMDRNIWTGKKDCILKMLHLKDGSRASVLLDLMVATRKEFHLEPEFWEILEVVASNGILPSTQHTSFILYKDLILQGMAPPRKANLLPLFAKTNDVILKVGIKCLMDTLTHQYLGQLVEMGKIQHFVQNSYKELAEVAKIFIQDAHRDNKIAGIDWFSFLVYQGHAYKEAKDALSLLGNEPNQPLNMVELMLHLVDKTQEDPESLLKMGFLKKKEDQETFSLMHSLLHAQPEAVAKLLESRSIPVRQMFDICKILINGNRMHSDNYFLVCELAKKDPRFIPHAFRSIESLFDKNRAQKETIEMIQIVMKNKEGLDSILLGEAVLMLMTLVSRGAAQDEAKAVIAEFSEKADSGLVGLLVSNLKTVLNCQEEIQKAQPNIEKAESMRGKVEELLKTSQGILNLNLL